MALDFLTRSIDLLASDGALTATGLRAPAFGRPLVLVARERCRFELFRAPEGLRGSAATAAARTFAQTRAPYEAPGFVIARQGPAYGVWWWDLGWVGEQLARHDVAETARILPETMGQPEFNGWRVLRDEAGFEGQVWTEGFLVGSVWRRRPFDAQAWSAFTRVRHTDAAAAPEAAPSATSVPYTARSAYRRRLISTGSLEDLAPLAVTAGAGILICATALMVGQGLRLGRERAGVERELDQARLHASASQRPKLTAKAQQLQALRLYADRPDPLALVAHAQRILAPFKLKASGFEANSDQVTLIVPAEAVVGVDLLAEELEASPDFADVRPSLDRQKKELTLKMTVRHPGPPYSPGAGSVITNSTTTSSGITVTRGG